MMNPRHTHSTTSTILFSPNTGPLQPPRRIRPCLAALKPMSSTAPPARPGASFPSSGTPTSKKKSAGPSSWAALAKPAAPFAVAAPPAAAIPDPETAQQRHARALRKHLAADPDASAKRAQELAAIRAAWGGSTTKEAGRLGTNGSVKKRRCVVCSPAYRGGVRRHLRQLRWRRRRSQRTPTTVSPLYNQYIITASPLHHSDIFCT